MYHESKNNKNNEVDLQMFVVYQGKKAFNSDDTIYI